MSDKNNIEIIIHPKGDDDEPEIPVEVLEAIDGLDEGNTASKESIEAALKF